MIKSTSYNITLAYCEMAALEDLLIKDKKILHNFLNGASYSAGPCGVTVYCISEAQARDLWNAVLKATDGDDDDSEEE